MQQLYQKIIDIEQSYTLKLEELHHLIDDSNSQKSFLVSQRDLAEQQLQQHTSTIEQLRNRLSETEQLASNRLIEGEQLEEARTYIKQLERDNSELQQRTASLSEKLEDSLKEIEAPEIVITPAKSESSEEGQRTEEEWQGELERLGQEK